MKNIFPIFSLAIIFFFLGFILLRFSVKNFLIDKSIENKFTDIVVFDAKDFFKKEENERKKNAELIYAVKEKLQITTEEQIFKAKDYSGKTEGNRFYAIKGKIESYTKNLLPFRLTIVQSIFFIDSYLGNKILPNNVVDLGEGHLTETFSNVKQTNIDTFVQKISYFKHILDSLDIPLVYVQYPRVICNKDKISKTGKDLAIQTKNEFMKNLIDIGIPIIDLHKEFHKRANDSSKEFHHSLFYKTDHHWQEKTAIWAGQIISEKLNDFFDFGLETELLDTANFTEIFAKKWLGSIGKKVIPLYPEEEFYIYSPKYATNISWTLHHSEYGLFENNGNFDSFHHFLPLARKAANEFYNTAYPKLSLSRNNDLPNGKKILLIGDSFNLPLSKFFPLVFKEVNFIYRRSSLLDDYLTNKPDIVVIGFSNAAINEQPETLLF